VEIRAFHRTDRDQLTEMVNAHIAAVVPGWAVSVAALLAQLEREPAQHVVDPWVVERAALVGLRRARVVAGAYLKRYGSDARVMPDYIDAGEISWLVCLPQAADVGRALAAACVRRLETWGVSRPYAEGDLPTLEVQPEYRRRGVGSWLVRTAVAWLRLGGSTRMLAEAAADMPEPEMERFYARFGWHEICRTRRGWRRRQSRTLSPASP